MYGISVKVDSAVAVNVFRDFGNPVIAIFEFMLTKLLKFATKVAGYSVACLTVFEV